MTVFGRTHSFDPQTDPVVRIEAGKLRSKLEHFYYARAGKEPIRIDAFPEAAIFRLLKP